MAPFLFLWDEKREPIGAGGSEHSVWGQGAGSGLADAELRDEAVLVLIIAAHSSKWCPNSANECQQDSQPWAGQNYLCPSSICRISQPCIKTFWWLRKKESLHVGLSLHLSQNQIWFKYNLGVCGIMILLDKITGYTSTLWGKCYNCTTTNHFYCICPPDSRSVKTYNSLIASRGCVDLWKTLEERKGRGEAWRKDQTAASFPVHVERQPQFGHSVGVSTNLPPWHPQLPLWSHS